MNETKIDFTKAMKKLKFDMMVDKIKEGGQKAMNWVSDNKEIVIAALPIVGGLVAGGINAARKNSANRETQRLKENYIWDPRSGQYFETRKPLSNSQRLEFAERRDHGEGVADILRNMRVLK